MAALLFAGAGALATGYMLKNAPEQDYGPGHHARVPVEENPVYNGDGIWKPVNNNAFTGMGISEAVAANAPEGVLEGGPDEDGDAKSDPRKVAQRLSRLHRRNTVSKDVVTTQIFNPYRLQKYKDHGNSSPLQMAFLTEEGSMAPYETVLDKSPYVLHGYEPIRERGSPYDYEHTVTRQQDAVPDRIDWVPGALRHPPVRPASKGPNVHGFHGVRHKPATTKRQDFPVIK